jgi:hypothetical protein
MWTQEKLINNASGTTMKMGKLLIIIFLFTLLGCEKPKTDFQKAFENYKQLKLPMKFNSKQDFDLNGITRDSIGLGGVPLGKLFQSGKTYTSVVLSIPVYRIIPHIFTQDENGKILDELLLFKTAGSEPGFSSIEDFTILPDRTIIFVDSTETFEYTADSLGLKEIPGTRRLTVTTEKYTITDGGKIKKID